MTAESVFARRQRWVMWGSSWAFMMNHTDGWMGGGMWIWTVIGVVVVVVVVLLVVVIGKLSKK